MNKIETAKIVTIVAMIAAVGAMTILGSMSLLQQQASAQEEEEPGTLVIHYPSGDLTKGEPICVSEKAASKHVRNHGDFNTGIPCFFQD